MTKNDIQAFSEPLLAEYKSAHDSFHNFDAFRWRSGSMIIGASVVLWGFLFSGKELPSGGQVAGVSVFTSLLLSCWLLYANHYRQLYMSKLYRIHQIEHKLGMELNALIGFPGLPGTKFKIYGAKGHNVDMAVYILVSLFGPIYKVIIILKGIINNGATVPCHAFLLPFLSIPIIFFFIYWISKNEKKMQQWYLDNPPWSPPQQTGQPDGGEQRCASRG